MSEIRDSTAPDEPGHDEVTAYVAEKMCSWTPRNEGTYARFKIGCIPISLPRWCIDFEYCPYCGKPIDKP
ncbi:MAG: hypothetical protein GY820_39250 [Gammaproteobacteria bacterium]|nr:hypothetical protein [Gammaproteobacteria bacterium]